MHALDMMLLNALLSIRSLARNQNLIPRTSRRYCRFNKKIRARARTRARNLTSTVVPRPIAAIGGDPFTIDSRLRGNGYYINRYYGLLNHIFVKLRFPRVPARSAFLHEQTRVNDLSLTSLARFVYHLLGWLTIRRKFPNLKIAV
jgi:hypothetical protein